MTQSDAVYDIVRGVLAQAQDGVVPIVAAGTPVLRTGALPYDGGLGKTAFAELIEVMRATMHDAPGVGLAAPQIGIPLQIAVVEDMYELDLDFARARERGPLPFRVLVNPQYSALGSNTRSFYEGCLSVPGYQAVVTRPASVRLRCTDENGRDVDESVQGWPARIVQHETDHLGGVLYIDRAVTRSLAANDVYSELWAHPTPERAARELGFAADL